MKLNDVSIILFLAAVICCFAIIKSIEFFGEDNPVEEVGELVLKKETGIEVDITPNSTE